MTLDVGTVKCGHFGSLVGSAFTVKNETTSEVVLELISAVEYRRSEGIPGRIPFCLTFRGPRSPVLPQRIYRFKSKDSTEFEVFVVPVGPDRLGMQYEVQFA